MPTIKTPRELATEAQTLARSYELVLYRDVLYKPVDYQGIDDNSIPAVENKCWKPLTIQDVQQLSLQIFDTLFTDVQQSVKFYYMVSQIAEVGQPKDCLLIKTDEGLRVLNENGTLTVPDGSFIPNTLTAVMNTNEEDREKLFGIVQEWLGGEKEEAISLLRHLATSLSPGWSAGKYILLMGTGRNGKSVLMKMLAKLFGPTNISGITRQDISDASPAVLDLNGKLLNIVFDGAETYLKDSGREKSLITGEEVWIRKLYQVYPSMCKTNALFIEGLNNEPRSRDKSSALQARLVRFWFPNQYEDNLDFQEWLLSERMQGAFLSLLLEHFVKPEQVSVMLAPTARSIELKLEHMEANSMALQYLVYLDENHPVGVSSILGEDFDSITRDFQSWRLKLNDMAVWDTATIIHMFRPVVTTGRKSVRKGNGIQKVRVVTGLSRDAVAVLKLYKEEEAQNDTVVED